MPGRLRFWRYKKSISIQFRLQHILRVPLELLLPEAIPMCSHKIYFEAKTEFSISVSAPKVCDCRVGLAVLKGRN